MTILISQSSIKHINSKVGDAIYSDGNRNYTSAPFNLGVDVRVSKDITVARYNKIPKLVEQYLKDLKDLRCAQKVAS